MLKEIVSNNESKNNDFFEAKIENKLTLRKQKFKIELNKKRYKNDNNDNDSKEFDLSNMDLLKEKFLKIKELFKLEELFITLTQSDSIAFDERYFNLLINNKFDISSISKIFSQKDFYFNQLSKNVSNEDFHVSLNLIKEIVDSKFLMSTMIEDISYITPFLFYYLIYLIKELNYYTLGLKSVNSFLNLSSQICSCQELIEINNKFNSTMINILEESKKNYDISNSINKIITLYNTIINIFSNNAEIIIDSNSNFSGMNCELSRSVCSSVGIECSLYVVAILDSCFEEYKNTIDTKENNELICFYLDIISCSLCCLGNMLSDNENFNTSFFIKFPHHFLINSMTNITNHLPDPCYTVIEEILYTVHSMNFIKPIDINKDLFFMYYADFYKAIFDRLNISDNLNKNTIKEFIKHFKYMLSNQLNKKISGNFSDSLMEINFFSIVSKILNYLVYNKLIDENSKDFFIMLKTFNKLMLNGNCSEKYIFYFNDKYYDENFEGFSEHFSYNLIEFCTASFQHFLKCSQDFKNYHEYLAKTFIKKDEKLELLNNRYITSLDNIKQFWDYIKEVIHNFSHTKPIKLFAKNSQILDNMMYQLHAEDSLTFYLLKAFCKITDSNSNEVNTYFFSKRYYENFIDDKLIDYLNIKDGDRIKKLLCWGDIIYKTLGLSKNQLKFTNIFKEALIRNNLQEFIIAIKDDLELPETVHNFYNKIISDYLYEFEESIHI